MYTRAPSRPRGRATTAGAVCFGLLAACSGGGGADGPVGVGVAGTELPNPDGGSFFLDVHRSGRAASVRIRDMFWGRLVDVHDVDAEGVPSVAPIFPDMVIDENVVSDGLNYVLDTNPVTQKVRLIIQRAKGAPETGGGTFDSLLRDATAGLAPVEPKHDDGTALEPISFLARNATLVVRFDDLMDDSPEAEVRLPDVVRVLTGYPPRIPYAARMFFDPNHGGLAGERFHSTRLLIDLTVTEAEASDLATPVPLNALGLPTSQLETGEPSVSVRFPTHVDFGSGQFALLTNLAGNPLATTGNGPVDSTVPTVEVVRALRAGNEQDTNNGFLLDLEPPRILGNWNVRITSAEEFLGPRGSRLYRIDVHFETACQGAPAPGDILRIGQRFLEVTRPATVPDLAGDVRDVEVRIRAGGEVANPVGLLGLGRFVSPYDASAPVDPLCWFDVFPQPRFPPAAGVSSSSQFAVRFSEPMEPASLRSFETIRLIRGPSGSIASPTSIVVASATPESDLSGVTLSPLLPLSNTDGLDYLLELQGGPDGVTDLSGNALVGVPPQVSMTLDPGEPPQSNGGLVLRFSSRDELDPLGAKDFRGQAVYDEQRGVLTSRPIAEGSLAVDDSNPVIALMAPFPPGLQTPLSPLGSKMQGIWRYVDVGWRVRDETKYDIDVVGMSWSPARGNLVADYYDRFEMALAHSLYLPDESGSQFRGPAYGASGLRGAGEPFVNNLLDDPRGAQKVVHDRSLGYRIVPGDLYFNGYGTPLVPFPLNRGGGPRTSYTWRDLSVLAVGGDRSAGIPLAREVGAPLFIEPESGAVAPPGMVPSIGLPLLFEIRCFPSTQGIGLNALRMKIALNTYSQPNFRAFSTGGINQTGAVVLKDPDLELFPSGGFNPQSKPPGRPTPLVADNSFYIGELEIVIRVSRAHTIWIDTKKVSPSFTFPVIEPEPDGQPPGTSVVVDYRGADSFDVMAGQAPFDADFQNAYGEIEPGLVNFHGEVSTWASDIRDVDGAQFIQLRFTLIANIDTKHSPELDSFGLAYRG